MLVFLEGIHTNHHTIKPVIFVHEMEVPHVNFMGLRVELSASHYQVAHRLKSKHLATAFLSEYLSKPARI